MNSKEIKKLKKIATEIRINILKMIAAAGSGHPAGSLGSVELLTSLYFGLLKHNPKNPQWQGRDYFILSAGHICPVLYATLAQAGYFDKKELLTLRNLKSRLQGHPERNLKLGIETTSGSLGQGLSIAAGLAAGLKADKKKNQVVCLTSDGEHDEGQLWEAVMFAKKYRLNNLINIIDRNYIQIDGSTEIIMPLDPLKKKYKAFGWRVYQIDGHDFKDIYSAYKRACRKSNRPTVIIAKTIPGKGISCMEGNCDWHGKAPTLQEVENAIKELTKISNY
jgi:transketolase